MFALTKWNEVLWCVHMAVVEQTPAYRSSHKNVKRSLQNVLAHISVRCGLIQRRELPTKTQTMTAEAPWELKNTELHPAWQLWQSSFLCPLKQHTSNCQTTACMSLLLKT